MQCTNTFAHTYMPTSHTSPLYDPLSTIFKHLVLHIHRPPTTSFHTQLYLFTPTHIPHTRGSTGKFRKGSGLGGKESHYRPVTHLWRVNNFLSPIEKYEIWNAFNIYFSIPACRNELIELILRKGKFYKN